VDGIPYISGDVKGRTQDNFGRFSEMDKFAYDQELQGRDNFFGSTSDLGEFGGFGSAQQIVDYFNTPGLTPLQGVQTMMRYNLGPEDIASALGLTPEDARAQWNAALAPFAPVVTPPPTTVAPPVVNPDIADLGTDPLAFLEDYFDTPGLTPEDAVRRIKELGISPEQAASYLGISPSDARQQYDAVIAAQQAEADRLREERRKAEEAARANRTIDDDIRDWFEANPDATAKDVFDVMQSGQISPEDIIRAMNFDPVKAMAEYNAFLNPANAPTATPTPTPM
jgi:hypothetical protein